MATKPEPGYGFDPTILRVGADVRRLAIEPSRRQWHQVRRGVWLPPGTWEALSPDQRYEAFVFGTLLRCREPEEVVVVGHAAAAVWGLPSIEPWPRHVAVHDPGGRRGPSRHIRPRHGPPPEAVRIRGVRVTTPARTVIDLACIGTLDTALAAADQALRLELCTREELAAEAALLIPGVKGRGTAGLVVDLADGLSDSPGESVSRLQMFRGNFPRPVLQREYRDEGGLIGYVDFDLPGLIGEFDGRLKYRVPDGALPQQAGDVVWAEKRREDRLRRFKPVARWTWETARDTTAMARLLISHGLRPRPTSVWFDLGARDKRSG